MMPRENIIYTYFQSIFLNFRHVFSIWISFKNMHSHIEIIFSLIKNLENFVAAPHAGILSTLRR